MRDEEFKDKLTAVAEWYIPLDIEPGSGQQNKLKKLARLKAEGEPIGNDTYPVKLLKIKHLEQPCEDCGKMVQGHSKEIQFYNNNKICGRKEKCMTCGLHKDPYTGEFCLTGTQASIKWSSFSKGVGRRYKTKTESTKTESTSVSADHTVIENSQEKITIYHQDPSER